MNQSKHYQLILMLLMTVTTLALVACAAASQPGDTSQTPGAANSVPGQTSGETPESSAPTMEATAAVVPTTEATVENEQGSGPATSEAASDQTMGDDQMAGGEFDQMFIDMMVPHHQSAIEMARVMQEQGENPELKQMAESMIQSQQAEIEQLQQWRQQWYGSSETPPMTQMPMLPGMSSEMGHGGEMMTMDMTSEIERVRNAPQPIDATFIEAMTQHHQMAIEAATMAEQQATHQEIKDMARNIIQEQQQEISEMERIRGELEQQSAESQATPTP
jgi:uncharacterized protein (DUF305 family)